MAHPTITAALEPAERELVLNLTRLDEADLDRMARALDDWAASGEPARPNHVRALARALAVAASTSDDIEVWEQTLRARAIAALRPLYEGGAESVFHACATLERIEHTLSSLVDDDQLRERIYKRTGCQVLFETLARVETWIDRRLAIAPRDEVVLLPAVLNDLRDEIELIGLDVIDR